MQISIVGGCGFIGRSLLSFFLKKKYKVKIIDTKFRIAKNKSKFYEHSIINYNDKKSIKKAIDGTDILINLYSSIDPFSSMTKKYTESIKDIQINFDLFHIAKELSVKKIIFASSGGTVYGISKTQPISEENTTDPISTYGIVKLSSENILSNIDYIDYYNLRISNIYGPLQFKDSKVGIISKILESIFDNKEFTIWGDGSIIRDYLYIEDLNNLFDLIINTEINKGTYNISSNYGVDINNLIKLCEKISKKKMKIKYSKGRPYDVPVNILDNSKIINNSIWKPKIDINEGIQLMSDQYKLFIN